MPLPSKNGKLKTDIISSSKEVGKAQLPYNANRIVSWFSGRQLEIPLKFGVWTLSDPLTELHP